MADNKDIKGPADQHQISLKEEYELDYWTKALGVDRARLGEAVVAVGSSAEKVREWLKANPQ